MDSSDDPVMVIDAKNPEEELEDYHYQVSGYALLINQRYRDKNPIRYTVLTNGRALAVYPWDGDSPILYLRFEDFQEDSEELKELESALSYKAFNQVEETEDVFEFYRPELGKLTEDFKTAHDTIWSKEKIGPTKAFYEFAKIMFLKIRHDQQIHHKLEEGNNLEESDFYFSNHWIEQRETVEGESHPFKNILFSKLKEDLERQIRENNKKRIFGEEEELDLKPSTVKEVVEILENYDLYGIGEDLNGRMFETFLNATIRGKELGQYFTPRSIVKYMTNTANIEVSQDNVDTVFDGCCGTGGFLIEAMANMLEQVENMNNLSSHEEKELIDAVKTEEIWGIDANPRISKIARLNMYLHGDGGNNIFQADALDKDIRIEDGEDEEVKEGKEELEEQIQEQGQKFDYVLTNPPFSMKYSKSNDDEKRVLDQYEMAEYSGSLKSTDSNVLFLERYLDLLEEDGELFTVIDDTVLNGTGYMSQFYRDWILDNFIVKQVISLPFNTFFKAEANIKTSILHLKKKREGEEQGEIFMGVANNIGHDDHTEDTPDRDNMKMLESYYQEYRRTGALEPNRVDNQLEWESLSCPMQAFTVSSEELNRERLDAFYYSPVLEDLREDLKELEENGDVNLKEGNDFNIVDNLSKDEREELEDETVKYVEISDVTNTGEIVNYEENKYGDISTSRAKLQVEEGDVVFPKNISSRGKAFIVPEWFDGDIVTTGFIAIRPESERERLALWSFLRSPLFTTQQYYLCVTASQPELRPDIFKEEVLVPIPESGDVMDKITEKSEEIQGLRQEITDTLIELEETQVGLLEEEQLDDSFMT